MRSGNKWQQYATPPNPLSHTHTSTCTHSGSSACMPKGLNHSSCLVSCSTQVLYCYWSGCYCTAARQIHNMIVRKANCGVVFPGGMKKTHTHGRTHTYICNEHAAESEMTDITTHANPHLKNTHTHTHIQLSWGTCQSSDSALQGFLVDYSRGGGFLLEDKQPATCTPPWRSYNWA